MIAMRHILMLLCLFAATVAIRWPNLGRPMSKHHEFCTATALRVLTVWHQEGIGTVGYNPATNFAGKANKFINNHASGSGKMLDEQGNYYYVSHPPLAYYLPYAVFSVFDIEPDVLPLQFFNLFVNLLCGFGIYLLARRLLPSNAWIGLLATLVYWFAPAVLWFQSNVYMSDMMVQPFFIAALLLALYVAESPKPLPIVGLGLVCFLGTYTTWFGMFIAFSLGIYFLFQSLNRPVYLWVIGVLAVSQLAASGLLAWQYGQIAGWDALWSELTHRFALRGSAPKDIADMSLMLVFNYVANYGALVIFIPILLIVRLPHGIKSFAFISLLPIGLMHLLLVNYTGHDFTTLYLAVPLSLLVAALAVGLHKHATYKSMVLLIIALSVTSGPLIYLMVNPYGNKSFRGDRYDEAMIVGHEMALSPKDAAIFYIQDKNGFDEVDVSPEALWYAKRNIKVVGTEEEAREFLRERGIETGVIFYHPFWAEFEKTKTIYLQGN